jgi:hypothetical protein
VTGGVSGIEYLFGPTGYLKGGGGYCYEKYVAGYRLCNTVCKGVPPPFLFLGCMGSRSASANKMLCHAPLNFVSSKLELWYILMV